MKQTYLLVVLFFLSFISAQTIPDYQDKYVNDFANVLTLQQASELRTLFSYVDENTTAEVVFVSSSDCEGDYDNYAMQIAESWKIGKADKDNGLLILYCLTENKITVKTGYGLEGILPDSKVGRFLDQYYVPQRDSGNVSQGVVDFSYGVSDELILNAEEIRSSQTNNSSNLSSIVIFLIILAIVVLIFVFFISRGKVGKTILMFTMIRMITGLILAIMGFIVLPSVWGVILVIFGFGLMGGGNSGSRSNRYGGSSFGGGGFSGGGFGGGGFGGGGASR